MYRFYRAYLFCLVLFYPAYWLLTGLPQVYAYFMLIMLLAVYLFELFRNKARE
ncbi:hypothetical protein [Pedobacter frigoris]|uniref:hypothetical protein n=1 Tax=Pedobacter frigoris TaxID=2571272 RepID=UPI002930B634|nr:hypothetical protein [Pedobacter frigoris]